jgi:hypothetical protein
MADLAALANYEPDTGSDLELRGLDGAQLFNDDGSPMTITLLGEDSDVAVKARNSQTNRRIQAGPRAKITAEGISSDTAAYFAKLTTGWNITLGGDKAPFSYEEAVKLYSNPKLSFVREQVAAFVEDRSNFLRGS